MRAALGLVLLAALVRLPTLAEQSFWLDEAFTEHLVRLSLGGMLHAIPSSESTPPLYYVLAWCWTRAFGYSELGLRSLSALAGILTVPVIYAVSARLAGRRAGLIAGALVALAPLMVWFSQEARAYALATLLSALTLLCFVAFLDGRSPRWLAGWALSSGLGLATHYFVVFVVVPELVWLLWARRSDRRVRAAVAFTIAAGVALVPLALAQRGTGHADYISRDALGTRLVQLPKQLLVGYASPAQVLTSVLAALLVLAGGIGALHASRGGSVRRASVPLRIAAASVSAPILLAFAGVDFLNTRNLLPALPAVYVAVGIGFAAWDPPRSGIVLAATLGLVFVAVLTLVDTDQGYQRDDWRGASSALGAAIGPRAILVNAGGLLPMSLYQPGLSPLNGSARVSEVDVIALPAHAIGSGLDQPPQPRGLRTLPAGFRVVAVSTSRSYTVLRLRASTSRPLTAASLSSLGLGPGASTVLLQLPPTR